MKPKCYDDGGSVDAMTPERAQFDVDVSRVKKGMKYIPEEGRLQTKERGMGPEMARRRLAERGVDVEGLVGGRVRDDAMGMKRGGKVSSASSRADGIAQRGKTRGMIVACGGGYMKGKK